MPKLMGMTEDDLDDVEANILVLIAEELDVQHRLEGHTTAVPACPVCRSHDFGPTPGEGGAAVPAPPERGRRRTPPWARSAPSTSRDRRRTP